MRSPQAQWGGGPDLEPLPSPSVTGLRSEVIAAVSFGRKRHIAIALRSYESVEALHGYRAIQGAAEKSEVVGECCHMIALSVAGCDRLRVEVIRIYEIDVLRTEMKSEVNYLPRRRDVVKLREGIDSLLLGFVARVRKRADCRFVQVIQKCRVHIKPVAN